MKARLVSSVLLLAALNGCATTEEQSECYANLGPCLLVGTAQTVGYVALAAVAARLEYAHEKRHEKKRGH